MHTRVKMQFGASDHARRGNVQSTFFFVIENLLQLSVIYDTILCA
jgi:hypothetical protein